MSVWMHQICAYLEAKDRTGWYLYRVCELKYQRRHIHDHGVVQ